MQNSLDYSALACGIVNQISVLTGLLLVLEATLGGFPGDFVVFYAEVDFLAGEDVAFEYCC